MSGADLKRKRVSSFFLNFKVLAATCLIFLLLPTMLLADCQLKVNINPSQARARGAKWRYQCTLPEQTGWSDWYSSGYTTPDGPMEPGNPYVIEFKDVDGWVRPNNIYFTAEFDTNEFTASYIRGAQICVSIMPYDARTAGAGWRFVGNETWHASGDLEYGLAAGTYEIEFRDIVGWIAPDNISVYVSTGEIKAVSATYSLAEGQLKVRIIPQEARQAGAQWSWGKSPDWFDSGHIESLQPTQYGIKFKPVRGWAAPEMQIVTVPSGGLKSVTYEYQRLDVGNVRIFADESTISGNNFTAMGNVRFAINTAAAPPDAAMPPGWTSDFVKVTGNVGGTLSPARIKGNGTFTIKGVSLPVIGNLPFYTGPYTINANNLKVTGIEFSPVWKYLGFNLEMYYWQLFVTPYGVGFGMRLDLPDAFYGDDSYIEIEKFEVKEDGIAIIGEVNITDFSLYGDFFSLKGLHGSIDTEKVSFSIVVDELSIYELPTFSASLIIEEKKLHNIAGGAYDIGFQIPDTPIYWQDLAIDLTDPGYSTTCVSLETIAFTLFDRFEGWSLLEFSGNATIDFTGYLGVGAYVTALGYELCHATFDLWWNEGLMASVYWTEPKFLLSVSGVLQVFWSVNPAVWDLTLMGSIGFDIPDWASSVIKFFTGWDGDSLYLAKGILITNDSGFTCYTTLLGFIDIHFTIPAFWDSPKPSSVNFRRLKTAEISDVSPAKAQTFAVADSCPAVIVSAQGRAGLPEVLITRPDGSKLDSTGTLPENSNKFVFAQDSESNVTSFFILDPLAGDWEVAVTNTDEAGKSTIYFVNGNCAPNVIPKSIEQTGDGYRLTAKAFDPDETATVKFYWSRNNTNFSGICIGEVDENDGKLTFDWTPGNDLPFKSGYVWAEIRDGGNQIRQAYFDDKLTIGTTKLGKPRMVKCKVAKDAISFRTKLRDKGDVDTLRVYYSGDLKEKVLADVVNIPVESKVTLDESQIKPGRRYQLRLVSVAADGSESPMSKKRVVDYRAQGINNHPYFTSEPVLETSVGSQYSCSLTANDYDGDALTFSLEEGPEGMTLEGNTLKWTPSSTQAGNSYVSIKVEDGKGGEDVQQFTIVTGSAVYAPTFVTTELTGSGSERALVIRVGDHLAGSNPTVREKLRVSVRDSWNQGSVEVVLTETAGGSNIFQGTLRLGDPATLPPVWLASDGAESSVIETVATWKDRSGSRRSAGSILINK